MCPLVSPRFILTHAKITFSTPTFLGLSWLTYEYVCFIEAGRALFGVMCERLPFVRVCPDIHKAKEMYHTSKAPLIFRSPCNPPGIKHKWNPHLWSSRAEEIRVRLTVSHYRVSNCLPLRDRRWRVEVNNSDSFIDCRNSTFRQPACYSCQINALFGQNSCPSTCVAKF